MSSDYNNFEQKAIKDLLQAGIKEKRATRRWGIFFKLVFIGYLGFAFFSSFNKQDMVGISTSTTGGSFNAVVNINGPILPGKESSAEKLSHVLKKAFESDKSKTVVLNINSPGGSPVQSNLIYQEINRLKLKHNKPVVAYIEDVGASGAYWIACAADAIYADQASIVGSIGVVVGSFGFQDALGKLGIERRVYTAGKNKVMLDPFAPESKEDVKILKQRMGVVHDMFIKLVKDSRKDKLSNDKNLFEGQIWLGVQAKEVGLIDDTGSLKDLILNHSDTSEFRDFSAEENSWFNRLNKIGKINGKINSIMSNWWNIYATSF